jgi:hypothetical protein
MLEQIKLLSQANEKLEVANVELKQHLDQTNKSKSELESHN